MWLTDQFLQSTAQHNASAPGPSDVKSFSLKSSIEVSKSDVEKSEIFENSFIDGKSLSESYKHDSMERTAFSFNVTFVPTPPVSMDTVACVNPRVHDSLSTDKKNGNRL